MQAALLYGQALGRELVAQVLVQRGDPVVVEARRRRPEHRHVLPRDPERLAVAHQLPGDIAPGVFGAPAFELVDGDGVGEVEHVDLLQLRGGAELGRHDIQREVDEIGDRRIALPDAGRLDDDEVEAGGRARRDHVGQVAGHLGGAASGGQRAEEDAVVAEAVHPDPVAEQGTAAASPARVDGEHRGAQLVVLIQPQSVDQLVGERGLAGAARTGDAEDH